MKHLNFIPEDQQIKFEIPHELAPVSIMVLAMLFVAFSAIQVQLNTRSVQTKLTELRATNDDLAAKITQVSEKNRQLDQNSEVIKSLQKVVSRKNYWSEIFKELSILIPDGIWLTHFAQLKPEGKTGAQTLDHLVLRGESPSQGEVARFLQILEGSHHFSGARINFSEKEENIKPSRYRFEFLVPIKTASEGSS